MRNEACLLTRLGRLIESHDDILGRTDRMSGVLQPVSDGSAIHSAQFLVFALLGEAVAIFEYILIVTYIG